MNKNDQESIFINGKAQIMEMLQYMNQEEKYRLIKNIQARNPQLAQEMMVEGLTFENILNLPDNKLAISFSMVKAPIWGIALKGTSQEFQRKILSLAPREYAEEAYTILTSTLQNEKRDIPRAQKKIISIFTNLSRKGQLRL